MPLPAPPLPPASRKLQEQQRPGVLHGGVPKGTSPGAHRGVCPVPTPLPSSVPEVEGKLRLSSLQLISLPSAGLLDLGGRAGSFLDLFACSPEG